MIDRWGAASAKERAWAEARHTILLQWRAYLAEHGPGKNRTALTDAFLLTLDPDTRPGRATLYLWDRRERDEGLAGLLPRYGGERPSSIPEWAQQRFDDLYMDQAKRSVRSCYDVVLAEARATRQTIPGYSAFAAHVRAIPEPAKIQAREGDHAYRSKCEPPILRDYTTYQSNEEWHADHCQLNVMARGRNGKLCRPWKTEWMDLRSRRTVGSLIYEGPPNTEGVLTSFGSAVRRHGAPQRTVMDNGREFSAYTVAGESRRWRGKRLALDERRIISTFELLHVSPHFTLPKNPRSRGALERKFRTDEERFDRFISSYCGNHPKARPEDFKDRLRSGVLTVEELNRLYREYLEKEYNERPHEGQGMEGRCPREVHETYLTAKRTVSEAELRFCLWKETRPLAVHRSGVRLFDRWYRFDGLGIRLGHKVYARYDPENLGRIWLFDLEDREIGPAECLQYLKAGASEADWRQIKRTKKYEREVLKEHLTIRARRSREPDPIREHLDNKPEPPPDRPARVIAPVRTAMRAVAKKVAYSNAKSKEQSAKGEGPQAEREWLEAVLQEQRNEIEESPNQPQEYWHHILGE